MTASLLIACVAVVFIAGLLQRLTGIGYALVASPIFIVAIGPHEAVRLVLVLGLVSLAMSFHSTRTRWQPSQVLPLLPFAVAVSWPIAFLSMTADRSFSSIIAGLAVLGALAVVIRPNGLGISSKWTGAALAGTLSGAMNAVAALGGPIAAAYGIEQRWGKSLVPNMQFFLFTSSVAVLVVRGWPGATEPSQLVILAASTMGGVAAGGQLDNVISTRQAQSTTFSLAACGALVAIAEGVLTLV